MKQFSPNCVTLGPIQSHPSDEHSENTFGPMEETVAGTSIRVIDAHPRNMLVGIDRSSDGSVTLLSDVQYAKWSFPLNFVVATGKWIWVTCWHFLNA